MKKIIIFPFVFLFVWPLVDKKENSNDNTSVNSSSQYEQKIIEENVIWSPAFDNNFDEFYEKNGSKAGTYIYNNGLWSVR
jgi:hypothetical protein